MASDIIGTLPSLHPHPSHSSMWALEHNLFDKLQAIQSSQSEVQGLRELAKQHTKYALKSAKYALKSATSWTNTPNPGPHCPFGFNAHLTHNDAEAIFDFAKME